MRLPRGYLSWSQMDLFLRDQQEYYRRYFLGQFPPPNEAMKYGSKIHKAIAERQHQDEVIDAFISLIPKYDIPEKKIIVNLDEIPLLGYIDSFNSKTFNFIEYKTGKTKWTQRKVDNHGQIDFYSLMIFQKYQVIPEAKLIWIEANYQTGISGNIYEFTTKRTMEQLLQFASKIKKVTKGIQQLYG